MNNIHYMEQVLNFLLINPVNEMNETQWGMKPNKAKAIMLAKRQLAEFVCDAVNLEGINLTLPEIQTLMDGITVGGHRLSDQQVALNQIDAWRTLFVLIEKNQFEITREQVCALHLIAGKDEALEWGKFRSGGVTIAGTDYMPPPADALPALFDKMVSDSYDIPDIYDRAIHFFLTMARCQFFYDVNKRMGRFIMNGLLLSCGYPAINLPAKRQQEFNQLMLDFYGTANQKPMNSFLRTCLDERLIKIMNE
ncbi:Fic/DOC family protein [Desulfobotulus alkaliphilus]|uniref:Fic/DOC family protein n=1 Tax=Desulfobotulus alkaliphilus TaxID=622671 RepID=A0A562QXR4_9BACT|nr:Fic/DOC family protein [Desulfobotulus alkaliphilus]